MSESESFASKRNGPISEKLSFLMFCLFKDNIVALKSHVHLLKRDLGLTSDLRDEYIFI